MALLSSILLFPACGENDPAASDGPSFSASLSALRSDPALMHMDYATETTTRYITDSENALDKVYATPYVEKQKVAFSLYEDGETTWVIEKETPEYPMEIPHETLPDNLPKITKTVISNGLARFYDASGSLLGQSEAPIPLMSSLADNLKTSRDQYSPQVLNQAIGALQLTGFVPSMDAFLAQAPSSGIHVETLEDNLISITVPNSLASGTDVPSTGETIHLFDRSRNLLLGTSIYDGEGTLLNSTFYRYDVTENGYRMAATRTRQAIAMPSGAPGFLETISLFSNFSMIFN